jgi:hypothetical protein
MTYKWLPLAEVLKYEPEMERLGVSKVARSYRGFLTMYKVVKSSSKVSPWWKNRRENFIRRHTAQYKIRPTYRRWLALIAWAYRLDRRFG